ncbi:CehA/McbA family metallohydrolase [Mesorhizobium sp. Cs1299R1N1]|uniref:CehA/McbA family metallohydrolase n=1 Tax=Mesorhizobium sp. Cs1299R1N1 TaxID=3015172 RepID=UPI00301DE118
MIVPPSPHFSHVDLKNQFNCNRKNLGDGFSRKALGDGWSETITGLQSLRGIPFLFGGTEELDAIMLRPHDEATVIKFDRTIVTYVIFVQAVADLTDVAPKGFGPAAPVDNPSAESIAGNSLGDLVSTYVLQYADGTETAVPIFRRFAIQQRHVCWGASPFAAMPAHGPHVYATHGEDVALGRTPWLDYGLAEVRTGSGRVYPQENLWLYALPNEHPEKEVVGIRLGAETEPSLVYAVSTTRVRHHPLRPQTRKKLRMQLPAGMSLNILGELDTDDRGQQIGMDLGTVISARRALHYNESEWLGGLHDVQPTASETEIIVEYAAHPDARLFLRTDNGTLLAQELRALENGASLSGAIEARPVAPATRTVEIRIVEKGASARVPARIHVHGPDGEYLPPKGHHRKVNVGIFEDNFADFANGLNQYAYIGGHCSIDLPLGPVFIEIIKGFEIKPLRQVVEITDNTESITFELEKVLHWRERGWVCADTHIHFLSPQTALLEGQAEGVNVVNLLATQWGEMFCNIGDFDGRTTFGARDFGGDGEFLLRVGTENRQQVLGHISLLGYQGNMIEPLCTGGPDEAAIGDPLESTMAEWAERCRQQGGLVVMPHAPNPQAERAADFVLGLVDALEVMTFNPRRWQISAFALADWYQYLNIGYHLPLVAGSDKMDAAALLGGIRTYSKLGELDFTFRNWMECIRGGDTFVTVGPLVNFTVEGRRPGSKISLPPGGGQIGLQWEIEAVSVKTTAVEIIRNGIVVEHTTHDDLTVSGKCTLDISESCWLAARVRGSVASRETDISAHTSAIFVEVGGQAIFAKADAVAVLAQIEGSIAYLDTLAPRSSEAKQARMRAALELAHHRLHHQLHHHGIGHHHTPLHAVHVTREH